MDYIDGFVAAVSNANKGKYIKHAQEAAKVFKDHGAKSVVECWGDDVPVGELTSFPKAVKCEDEETVVFAWVVWPSKETRNIGMEKVMNDPRMDMETSPMPFDTSRLIFGGFQKVVDV